MSAADCRDFARLLVADDPAEQARAREHAAGCAECAVRLRDYAALDAAAARWRAAAPAPPAELEARIRRSLATTPAPVAARRAPAPVLPFAPRPVPAPSLGGRVAPWLAAVAGIVLAAGLLLRSQLFERPAAPPSALLVEQALREAEVAEAAHARAIAQLEQAAAPVLARAEDPALPPREAAMLLAYRDRLRFLDRTVAEVDAFLAENPNHAKARTVLLAAYVEKTEVLREVLALEASAGGRS